MVSGGKDELLLSQDQRMIWQEIAGRGKLHRVHDSLLFSNEIHVYSSPGLSIQYSMLHSILHEAGRIFKIQLAQ